MKKFIMILVLLLALPLVFAAEEPCIDRQEVASDTLNVRYSFLFARAEAKRIGMETVIDFLEENDMDASELEDIKSAFAGIVEDAKEAADDGNRARFNDLVREGIELVRDFREETRSLEPPMGDLRQALMDAEEENKEYFQDLIEDAVEQRRELYLKTFDVRVCWHHKSIHRLEEKGHDVDALEEQLEDIEAKSEELADLLEEAEEACETPVHACTDDKADEFRALRVEINEDFVELNKAIVQTALSKLVQAGINILKTGADLTEVRLNTMERRGKDVADYKESLEDIQDQLEEAQSQFDDADYEAAQESLKQAREDFRALQQDIKEGSQ